MTHERPVNSSIRAARDVATQSSDPAPTEIDKPPPPKDVAPPKGPDRPERVPAAPRPDKPKSPMRGA
ncbi:hypothetical protein [Nannocystis punicea]|uniref:Uncharacterized protein n=1 Tax=Nannocystis punicea TaxID=2995304 RepID=A0ABY7GZS4_9BACT|nr:hypothetical protein [Nannocystis poenicansa]WAS92375.1 hypothetical protein O0S08_39860 [Nannocystis poenicansa]